MPKQKSRNMPMLKEELENTENVEGVLFENDNDDLHVWLSHGLMHSPDLDFVRQYGYHVEYINFENNHIRFQR